VRDPCAVDAQITHREHAANARVAQRAQLLFVGPRFVTTSVKRDWVCPIERIEPFLKSESVAWSDDESKDEPIAESGAAADACDEENRSASSGRPRPMFALWLITRCSLRMIK